MGIIRGVYRGGKRVVRAGNAVAHGRMPNIGVGVGLAGVGLRVGTKGIRVKVPLARVKVGSSGFRVTVGKPGIAHVSVRPLKPSAGLGVGPLRLNIARHPGIGARVGMVAVGVTTQPLVWARIGATRLAIPGQYQPTMTRWHEEIDKQWRSDYQRRPPSFLADLHHVIREMEATALSMPYLQIPDLSVSRVGYSPPTLRENVLFVWEATKAVVPTLKKWDKLKLLTIISRTRTEATKRKNEEILARIAESDALQQAADMTHRSWRNGDTFVNAIVCNASFEEFGCPANVVSIDEHEIVVLVLLPDLDDIHPEKPAVTPGGAPTVKKKSKRERVDMHASIAQRTALSPAVICARRTFGRQRIRVVGVTRNDHSHSITDLDVVVDTVIERRQLLTGNRPSPSLIDFVPNPRRLSAVLPETVPPNGGEIPALSVDVENQAELTSAAFWIEIAEASGGMSKGSPQNAQPGQKSGSTNIQQSTRPALGPTGSTTQPGQRPVINVNYRKIVDASSVTGPADIVRPQRAVLRARTVEATETRLLKLAETARAATEGGSAVEVRSCLRQLTDETPHVPEGADDEAQLVLEEMFNALIAISSPTDLVALAAATNQAHSSVRERFEPLLTELAGMVRIKDRIITHLKANPGAIQSSLHSELNEDKEKVKTLCWYLDHFDVILRTKKGNSYSLRLEDAEN